MSTQAKSAEQSPSTRTVDGEILHESIAHILATTRSFEEQTGRDGKNLLLTAFFQYSGAYEALDVLARASRLFNGKI